MQDREKIVHQYIMDYRAYRRIMITTRATVTAVVMGGLLALLAVSVPLGIIMPLIVAFSGAVWMIASINKEENYTLFNDRFVIKHKDKCVSVPYENMISVKYKRAAYEKDLATGTVYITALDAKGKKKQYRLRHIIDGKAAAEYLRSVRPIPAATQTEEDMTDETTG